MLLDLNLPDSTGLETLSKIHRATTAQIVVTTGNQDDKLGFDAIQAGAADFLPKNEKSGHTLSRVLAYAVERERLRKQVEESRRGMRGSREAVALSAISHSSSAKPIKAVAGEKPLREVSPDKFQAVVARYLDVVLMVADEKQYNQTIISRASLKKIAEMLFEWRCGPRDLFDMHVTAVEQANATKDSRSFVIQGDEPQFLLIELQAYLTQLYRALALENDAERG